MLELESLGKYTLRGTLGRGAMGTVYDGWDAAIDRRVAIKTVKLAQDQDAETIEALARFKREAQAAGRLVHPNIVGVYDYGETADFAYIVMEFVEGHSLKSVLERHGKLPPREAETIMAQVLAGLAYSHSRGVIHRDIKPANIMLTAEGQVKIADFGVARIESSTMTSVGMMIGTPAYMPPEQYLGEPADARSDIYAAGVMLFHLLAGERPYEGSMTTIMQKVLSTDPPPKPSARPGVPGLFDAVVGCAMAKAPAARYATAAAFAQALHAALSQPAPSHDMDETVVAPAKAAPRQSPKEPPKDLTVLQPAQDRAKPTRPADTIVEQRAKKGVSAFAIVAGLGLLLLAGGGGAWFLMRPHSGTPPSPAARVATVQEPPGWQPPPRAADPGLARSPALPSFTARLATLRRGIAMIPCNTLAASGDDAAGIKVHGLIGASYTGAAQELAQQAAAASVTLISVPRVYCQAIEVMRLAGPGGVLPVALGSDTERTKLGFGSPIEPRITAPAHPSWLTVDYLSSNGTVTHLAPTGRHQSAALAPGTDLQVPLIGCAVPPYGTDMILAVAATHPLFAGDRTQTESMGTYLPALRDALQAQRSATPSASAGGIVIVQTLASPGDGPAPPGAVANQPSVLRNTPRAGSRLVATLAQCNPLSVLAEKQEGAVAWLQAVTAAGVTGWVEKSHVTLR